MNDQTSNTNAELNLTPGLRQLCGAVAWEAARQLHGVSRETYAIGLLMKGYHELRNALSNLGQMTALAVQGVGELRSELDPVQNKRRQRKLVVADRKSSRRKN